MREMEREIARIKLEPLYEDYAPLNGAEMKWIEKQMNGGLPEDVQWFFMKYGLAGFNGVASVRSEDNVFPISVIYGGAGSQPSADESAYSLTENMTHYSSELGQDALTIGADEFGNQYYAKLRSGAFVVYYWDHETASSVQVASSLAEFLKKISIE
jgi:SMI1 / KNR4 family (SUKH-1)